jgi:phosphate transport system substrate-binding protein
MIADEDRGEQRLGIRYMLQHELSNDRYGIAWTVMPQAKGVDGIKAIALSPSPGAAPVRPGKRSFQDRSYPLVRNIYMFLNRRPGEPVEPKLREFLRYILSREGQDIVERSGGYLPLPADIVTAQRRKLD